MTEQLLSALRGRVNDQGQVVASEGKLCSELRVSRQELAYGLGKLRQAGLIEVLAPLPFLVARLRTKWPGRSANPAKSGAAIDSYSFQSSLSQSRLLNESYRQPEPKTPVTADGALLQEILETLGETDPTTFLGALRSYSPEVIRAALERVRRLKHIRKSRTAAFRFLLPRLAKESRSTN